MPLSLLYFLLVFDIFHEGRTHTHTQNKLIFVINQSTKDYPLDFFFFNKTSNGLF